MNVTPEADPIKQPCNHVPLCAKALAGVFNVDVDYIYAMRKAGAPFWGRVSTVAVIMEWWGRNPQFTRQKARKTGNNERDIGIQKQDYTKRRQTVGNGGIRIL